LTTLLFALRLYFFLRDRRRIDASVKDYEAKRREYGTWGGE
jgi:hypothetical protein